MKIVLRFGIVFLIIGLIGATVTAFAAKEDLEERLISETFIYEKDELKDIKLSFSNNPVTIYPSEDDKIKIIVIYEDYETLSIDKTDYKLNIAVTSKWLDHFFNGFKLFNLTDFVFDRTIKVYLPEALYDLDIKTSNGSIKTKGMTLDHVSLKTSNGSLDISESTFNTIGLYTSNGTIELNQVSAIKADLETSNGSLIIKEVSITELFGNTSNGKIIGSKMDSELINLSTSNGPLNLSILGSFDDYKVTTKTSNGKVKINEVSYGSDTYHKDKSLSVTAKTSNGDVFLNFSNDWFLVIDVLKAKS